MLLDAGGCSGAGGARNTVSDLSPSISASTIDGAVCWLSSVVSSAAYTVVGTPKKFAQISRATDNIMIYVWLDIEARFSRTRTADDQNIFVAGVFHRLGSRVHGEKFCFCQNHVVFRFGVDERLYVCGSSP